MRETTGNWEQLATGSIWPSRGWEWACWSDEGVWREQHSTHYIPMFLVWHRSPHVAGDRILQPRAGPCQFWAQLRDTKWKKLLGNPVHNKAFRMLLEWPQSRNWHQMLAKMWKSRNSFNYWWECQMVKPLWEDSSSIFYGTKHICTI